jgi:flagellar hook protein FlgE
MRNVPVIPSEGIVSIDPLNIGLSGLDAYGTQLDVTANNVANVGTAGFQGQNVTFQNVLAGVSVSAITTNPTPGVPSVAGALESSNVDLSDEFVKMMSAQAAFEANAQTVKTGDQDLKTIVNLDSGSIDS